MKKIILLATLLYCLSLTLARANENSVPPMPSDTTGKITWIKQFIGDVIGKETDPTKHFFGVVLDQFGVPVAEAEVEASWRFISLTLQDKVKVVTLKTDSKGRFDFFSGPFNPPLIRTIRKKGYEYNPTFNVYDTSQNLKESLIAQSANNPVSLTIRKMGPTTYLYSLMDNRLQAKEQTYLGAYNIFEPNTKPIKDLSNLHNPERYDLLFSTVRTSNGYQIHAKPILQSSFQFNSQLLYEAPDSGYLPEATLDIPFSDQEQTVYLYFISRNPAVYSRMRISITADENELRLYFRTWTNPYGSRNLEYEPNLPADLLLKLMDEAEDALKSGKLPPEPNIPQMIASGLYD